MITPDDLTRDIYKDWPEPLPMLLDSFAEFTYEPVPSIYIPACLTMLSTLMQSSFIAGRDRTPNLLYLSAAESGSGKDGNSKEAIKLILKRLIKQATAANAMNETGGIFQLLQTISANASAQTQFLKVISKKHQEAGGVLIIDTEGGRHFKAIGGTSMNNHYTQAIVDSEIELWNGAMLEGRITKDTETGNIDSPNVNIHRLCQTSILHENVNDWMIDKGYIPRLEIFYDMKKRKAVLSSMISKQVPRPNKDFIAFLMEATGYFKIQKTIDQVKLITGDALGVYEQQLIDDYQYLDDGKTENPNWISVKRNIMNCEKLLVIISAWVWAWKEFNDVKNNDIYEKVDIDEEGVEYSYSAIDSEKYEDAIIPFAKYLVHTKLFLLESVGTNEWVELDEIFDAQYAKLKATRGNKSTLHFNELGLVPKSQFDHDIKSNKATKKLYKENPEQFKRAFDRWMRTSNLMYKHVIARNKFKNKDEKKNCILINSLENRQI